MKIILIYSDCSLFGGSEHAVINLLRDNDLKQCFHYAFAYRYHSSYHKKICELLEGVNDVTRYPIKLLTNYEVEAFLRKIMPNRMLFRLAFAPFFLFDKMGFYELVNLFILKRFISKYDFDIVHVNNGGYPAARSCLLMTKVAKKNGKKVVLQVNNIAESRACNDNKTNAFIIQSVDRYITASQGAKKALCSALSMSGEKVMTIPHYVPFIKPIKKREFIFKRHSIPTSSIMIVEVALLQKRKGQEELVLALDTLSEMLGKPVELLLIGNGENKDNILSVIKQSRYGEHVHLLGYRDDYIDYLNAADIVALPSLRDEDMPLTIISALSLGKPVVSSKLAGIPEEIEDGISGILIDPQSKNFVNDLAIALFQAYNDRERLSDNACLRYKMFFSKEKFEESYKLLYNSL